MKERKGEPNNLGVLGWAIKGRWGMARYLYTLHRITGLGLIFYFVLHIFVTSTRVSGPEIWNRVMGSLSSGVFVVGEFLIFAAFAFHMFNGIRLILIEFGFAVGKAEEPVYPYESSVDVQRPLSIGMLALTVIVVIIGAVRYFMPH